MDKSQANNASTGSAAATFYICDIKTGPAASYRGQIIPLLRPAEELGDKQNVEERDWYGNPWLGPVAGCENYTEEALQELCDRIKFQEENANAVWIRVPQEFLATTAGCKFMQFLLLKCEGYENWAPPGWKNEFFYRKWTSDGPSRLPEAATAIQGVGVVAISPDGCDIALIVNKGRAVPTRDIVRGQVNLGESFGETAARELEEETGLEVDTSKPMQVLCFHEKPKARDDRTNDIHVVVAVHVLGKDFKIEEAEVRSAEWKNIEALRNTWRALNAGLDPTKPLPYSVELGGDDTKYNTNALFAINRYLEGQGRECKMIGGYPTF